MALKLKLHFIALLFASLRLIDCILLWSGAIGGSSSDSLPLKYELRRSIGRDSTSDTKGATSVNRAALMFFVELPTVIAEVWYIINYQESKDTIRIFRLRFEYPISTLCIELLFYSFSGINDLYAYTLIPLLVPVAMVCGSFNSATGHALATAMITISAIPILVQLFLGDPPDWVIALVVVVRGLLYAIFGYIGERDRRDEDYDPDPAYTMDSIISKTILHFVLLWQML